ncbi:MAG: ADP-forming succinate--CoA ligase subunit beta [Candidatus Marinimicrobia bacterium]|nr:ADP-forming succinate--CoA ligase subunit beta [Candidatus Neomarinimicrobiota bacterium]
MKIHEYESKIILKEFGVNVPRGMVGYSRSEILDKAAQIGYPNVLKAQILAGGRGKAGGVKLIKNEQEAGEFIDRILGKPLVTKQTGPTGQIVRKIYIQEDVDIRKELYISVLIDREKETPVLIASTEGGVEIEKVAAETPEKIFYEYADPHLGFQRYQFSRMAFKLGFRDELTKEFINFCTGMTQAFFTTDASLIENNPLVITGTGQLVALDAKISLDDNALYRHKNFIALEDKSEKDPLEIEAEKHHLNYIRLDGKVGCMVNGAGLAMATMDIIKHYGGEPANFLDVGGIASSATVANGFRVLLSDKNVKAVLVNIFGGIVRCDRVAKGILEALETMDIDIPIIIRLEGTNAEIARDLLNDSPLKFKVAGSFNEAARLAVAATQNTTGSL